MVQEKNWGHSYLAADVLIEKNNDNNNDDKNQLHVFPCTSLGI